MHSSSDILQNSVRVSIIGRPNVGKSTLFNRLYGSKRALVHDLPGVTRDRLHEKTKWIYQKKFYSVTLMDTGGLGEGLFSKQIKMQVDLALNDSDLILLVVDGQVGLTTEDEEVLKIFQRSEANSRNVQLILVVNKVDDHQHESYQFDFMGLGVDQICTVSAEHNRGIGELTDLIFESLPKDLLEKAQAIEEAPLRKSKIAIVGRPNVGKSTTLNALLGEQRMITSPIAGTTIDSIDSECEINGYPFTLIDTAGIRRKNKTEQGLEVLSVVQTKKALERCDLALLVVDAEEGLSDQDEKIGGLIEEVGASVIIIVNKWDTQKKNSQFTKEAAAKRVREQITFLKYAPIVFSNALTGEGFEHLGDLMNDILNQKALKISTNEFSEWVREEAEVHNPYNVKFYMCHQAGRHPPTFVCHVNNDQKVDFSLKRHLINAMRDRWGFMGSPIRLVFVTGKNRTGPKKKTLPLKKAPPSKALLPSKENPKK